MPKKIKRGFTLIELLVVIAIIAMLLAILMPSLKKAKEKAKQVVCKSNLKGIGLSVKLYLTDNADRMPEKDRFGIFYRWINPATGMEYEFGEPDYLYTYWGIAFKDYAKNKKIFSCPSFSQYRLGLDQGFVEYVMDDTKIEGGYAINNYMVGQKVTRIRNPSEYIIAQDHVEPMAESATAPQTPVPTGGTVATGDLYFTIPGNDWNVPQYRFDGRYTDKYKGLFRHSKKNSGLDRPSDQTRFDNIDDNPNGQADTLRLDGSVDGMRETTGVNVRESWYTGGIADPLDNKKYR